MLGIYLTTQIQSYVAHNPNVLPHVFTAKHRWDKFIKLTGNHQKDFESLVAFLEREKILQCPHQIDFAYQAGCVEKHLGRS